MADLTRQTDEPEPAVAVVDAELARLIEAYVDAALGRAGGPLEAVGTRRAFGRAGPEATDQGRGAVAVQKTDALIVDLAAAPLALWVEKADEPRRAVARLEAIHSAATEATDERCVAVGIQGAIRADREGLAFVAAEEAERDDEEEEGDDDAPHGKLTATGVKLSMPGVPSS